MATGRNPALLRNQLADPVLEVFDVVKTSAVSVGTSAVALPTTNLSGRKGIFIQNIHASNILYVGGSVPDIIEAPHQFSKSTKLTGDIVAPSRNLQWNKSAGGTNEWYVTLSGGGDPGLTEPVVMYAVTSAGGAETLLTNGTVASLSNTNWDWGNGDTLGFNTIYMRFNTGSPAVCRSYFVLYGYPAVPSATTGFALGPNDSWYATLSGSCRIFGVASGASTTTVVMELG